MTTDSGINALHDAALPRRRALCRRSPPASASRASRFGTLSPPLRKAGVILRRGGAKCRVFELPPPRQFVSARMLRRMWWRPSLPRRKKQRKRPVILFTFQIGRLRIQIVGWSDNRMGGPPNR